jgi:uncharacterized membrane protein
MLLGMLFLNPVAGMVAGAAAGATSGALTDIGVDDHFIKELGATLEKGTSALFILVRKATTDKVLEELKPFKGKILQTSLSEEDDAKLRAALEEHAS